MHDTVIHVFVLNCTERAQKILRRTENSAHRRLSQDPRYLDVKNIDVMYLSFPELGMFLSWYSIQCIEFIAVEIFFKIAQARE